MSMIASVLRLDRKAVKALRITDLYSLHRVVYSLYEDVRNTDEKHASRASGILFADQGGDFKERKILLLADRMPSDSIEGQHCQVQSKLISDAFLGHQRYRFKIVVNPTRRHRDSGKLIPVKGREAIAAWFCERAPQSWGFDVAAEHLQVDRVDVQQFKDKHQRLVTLAQAHLQGQLKVSDRAQFCNSFVQGVGRGRAFGCGLLQIVPVLENPFS